MKKTRTSVFFRSTLNMTEFVHMQFWVGLLIRNEIQASGL